jgi:hypothetical protein
MALVIWVPGTRAADQHDIARSAMNPPRARSLTSVLVDRGAFEPKIVEIFGERLVSWYLIERACFSLISAVSKSSMMLCGSCWRLTAVAMISSKGSLHVVELELTHKAEDLSSFHQNEPITWSLITASHASMPIECDLLDSHTRLNVSFLRVNRRQDRAFDLAEADAITIDLAPAADGEGIAVFEERTTLAATNIERLGAVRAQFQHAAALALVRTANGA